MAEKKWNIEPEAIKDPGYKKWLGDFEGAKAQMMARTRGYELYGLIAKNKSIHDSTNGKGGGKMFSEGSAQYILRKSLANTIQRVPDGELETQFDKSSIEHILTEYLFNNKVMYSEYEGLDMLANITSTFKAGFIYAFAPVRTGFEKDLDDDARISYTIENWADIFVNQDCRDIRRPQVVWHRSYMSKAEVEALLTEDGNVTDPTYKADTIKFVLDNEMFTGKLSESEKLGDRLMGSSSLASLELLTRYDRGGKEFVTYVPKINAEFRRVPNYDPRKEIPWDFFVLETDVDFPLGISQMEFLLADQQFQDLFQTSAYKNLLLAMEPPIMVAGWETNPASYRFEPRKIWNLGNNPNQAKVEPVKIDNSVLAGFVNTREAIAAGMLRQLNVVDGTLAKDSGVPGFSGTPQGVEAQSKAKEISINQYQKRVENFFANWANKALRMYINAMGGKHKLIVDEKTRRKIYDVGAEKLIDGDKVEVDFDALSTDMLEFKVRTGSLVEKKEDQERRALQETVQPFVQNLMGWSEQNKAIIENEILIPAARRMLELSDIDLGQTMANNMLASIQEAEAAAKQQAEEQAAQQQAAALAASQPPPEQGEVPVDTALPPDPGMGGTSPSSPPMPGQPLPPLFQEPAGGDVNPFPA